MRQDTLRTIRQAQAVAEGLREYWPLTLRQIYYQLVQDGSIENNLLQYQRLSRILTKARDAELFPWEAMEDRSRIMLPSGGWHDYLDFAQDKLEDSLRGYRRDRLDAQHYAIEVWIEKDALSHICHEVAFPYCVPVVVARGFSSTTYRHQCGERIRANAKRGKETVLLYFGDLDPSGWAMLDSIMRRLEETEKVRGWVHGIRCALTPAQAVELGLKLNPGALKEGDKRKVKYRAMLTAGGYDPSMAVELDALTPALLQEMVKTAIEKYIDPEKYRADLDEEVEERAMLETLQTKVNQCLAEYLEAQ